MTSKLIKGEILSKKKLSYSKGRQEKEEQKEV